jgi:hypothetical protein
MQTFFKILSLGKNILKNVAKICYFGEAYQLENSSGATG